MKALIDKNSLVDFYVAFIITVLLAVTQIVFELNVRYLGFFYLALGIFIIYLSFVKYQNVISLKSLFLIGNFFVFFIPLIYISFLFEGEWVSYKFSPEILSVSHIKTIGLLIGIAITSFLFGYMLPSPVSGESHIRKTRYMNIVLPILLLSFLVLIYRRYELLQFVSEHGFEAIYSKGFSSSIVEAIFAYVFIILAPIAYLLSESLKTKNVILWLIIAEAIIHGLAGQRVWILTGIIQVLFLINLDSKMVLNENMLKRIKLIFYLAVFALISVYLMAAMLFYREGESFDIFSFSVFDYFIGQFGTIIGLKIAIDNPTFVYGSNLPPLLDTLNPLRSSVQGFVDKEVANIGSRVTYLSCASCLSEGKSYGSSIYAQLYQFGLFGISIGTMALGYLAKLIDTKKNYSYIYALLGFFLAKHMLWSARGEYFPHYINILVILISVATLYLLLISYKWGKNG
ncbi:O-antigen polysaccharide polymerase Wzy [Pseudoalteromonas sp. NZS11]|uniref:O-antigen polysaccharide polymerase Wzy n=1 Tax=Pseudoalteromonas sp. NZS11 TaxID=2792049 RepID=UPI0018CCE3D5|nr:O-antigen polysaccharide polymerase Wzy [Pseudoalteromonas sp. NZS11]MBH0078183.1 O-antigen polysaccharide polymerase Wzy [Pseudoalteromonas sp. NZS11]